jgi:hypothetical protein
MRRWATIGLFGAVGLMVVAVTGCGVLNPVRRSTPAQRLDTISGVHNYLKDDPNLGKPGQHGTGKLTYAQSPPVGGIHNPIWMNCMGDVYDAQIPSEHAVHSLEHGAVWVTYNPDKLSQAQVGQLAEKVKSNDYMLMSPYPGLDKPVSLQAWGYQLKLDSVTDSRIDQFIRAGRNKVGPESGAACSGGISKTGTTPFDLSANQPSTGMSG